MSENLVDLYRHNLWANLRVIEYCRAQPDELLDKSVGGTYGSARATLAHLIAAEEGYTGRLRGGRFFEDELDEANPFPGFDDLVRRVQRTGAELPGLAATIADRAMYQVDEGEFDVRAGVILVQVINHATEHRAQIVTTLTTLGAPEISLDAWSWGFATGDMTKAER
ncbi:MAG: DinB family protein [Actinomycetota bacterium]